MAMFSSAPWITLVVIGSMRSGLRAGWRRGAVLMVWFLGFLRVAYPSRRRYAPPQGEVVFWSQQVTPHPEERLAGPRLEGWARDALYASSFRMIRLPAASASKPYCGGTTVVESICRTIAGPATCAPTGKRSRR